jgi:hypothetical protein
MTPRWIAVPTALGLTLAPQMASSTSAAQAARPRAAGFTIPLEISTPDQGRFSGTLRLLAFGVENGRLVAAGLLSGSRVDDAGTASSIVRTVKLPASAGTPAPPETPPGTPAPEPPPETPPALPEGDEPAATPAVPEVPATIASCAPLHVELGPLELDALGTSLRLDRVVIDVDPVTRAAVGALCGPTRPRGSGEAPRELARKLNRLLAALG